MRPYAPSRAPPMLDRIDFPIPPVTGDLNEANMTASRQPARGMDSRGLHADTSRHNICNGAPAWATRQTEPYLPSQLFPPNFCLENAESPRNLPPWRDRRPYPLPPPAPNPTTRRRSRALPTPPGGNINSPSHHDSLGRYQRSLAHTTQSTYTHLQAQIDHWRDECVRQNLQDSPAWGYSIVDEAKGKSKEVDPLTDLSDHPLRNPTLANDYKLTVAPPDIIDFNCGPSHVASVSGSPFSIPCQATGATSAPNNLALHNPPVSGT
ncbi:uncharacterized protein EI90DRAFT_1093206 [Cantharellus anzutake]|uniref:uncharacterized protein n=1 Tax=Cantharellus anzutake TaxID=1750568 RepID=UPI0019075BB0|nr:uncharacterized protein EI90DRAFT_1093206 [Cantharellus anzutake]KAF8330764.1 hypothetical protein EI90DRAFT_1093206 [Cantharellus anzutake]